MWPLLFSWLLAASAPAGGAVAASPASLLVSAAVSLTEAMTECGEAFGKATGTPVRVNFGASNALARQIARGAPVDVFVSADELQMAYAVRAGGIEPGSVTTVATNELVIVVPGRGAVRWSGPARLEDPSIHRIALGDPAAVPAGVYARQWLERIGLWRLVEPRVVPAASVRGALAAVSGGAADAGIVYRTDAARAPETTVVFEVSGDRAPAIRYPAAVVRQSRNPRVARQFVEFLRSAAGQRILSRHGFGPPADSATR